VAEMSAIEEFKRLLKEAQESSHKLVEQTPAPIVEEENIVQKTARLIRTKKDNTPSAPQDIEAQRWNDPLRNTDFVTQKQMADHYGQFLQRIQTQLSTVGGGGEVKLRMLDDVDRASISDGKFLKFDSTTNKFNFANVNANSLITNTTYVTTAEYTVQEDDYYIGVDYAAPTTIILPVSDIDGRHLVIKDEDGDAATNPITISGTIDNDAGGATLQINNGSLSLIYRNGWRII
jgi:hypothetical protein